MNIRAQRKVSHQLGQNNTSNHEKISDFKETLKQLSKNTNVLELMNFKKQKPAIWKLRYGIFS